MSAEGYEDAKVRWITLAMAAFATTALEQAVLEPGRSRGLALAMTVGVLIVPMIVTALILGRRDTRLSRENALKVPPPRGAVSLAMFLLLFALPFCIEAGRALFGGRTMTGEFILLASLRNLGLGLAANAHRSTHAKLSALVSLFLVTVASPVGGEGGPAVLVPVGGFALAGMFWLMLVYWKGLHLSAGTTSGTRRYPLTSAAWMLGIAALIAVVATVGPTRAATALIGLVPTSGGTGESDPNARSGVNDGDNEVNASENPQSVGFTESEIYLETDRPSLYDTFNESYGEPFKKKKTEKMIALSPQNVREQKERPAENLRAGREFSAVRKKPEPRPRRPTEREAKALVYIKGSTPLHLALTTYSHFNGMTWSEEPCCNWDLHAELEPHGTWLKLLASNPGFLSGAITHQVKIGSLDSSAMPLPSHLARFRVGSVNRPDFFGWAQYGIVRMTDRTVPAGTIIDTEARTVDPAKISDATFRPCLGEERDHHISFHGQYAVDSRVAELARAWVANLPGGWTQVEAVVSALRLKYGHDRTATASEGCTDVVAEFLLGTKRGPDYLFASASAVILRSLGYPVRLVSGLYAAPGRYDPITRHTPVTREDVHVWAEVRLPDGLWVAIEPTPGYELLPPARPWTEKLARSLMAAVKWGRSHWLSLSALALVLAGLVSWRRSLIDRFATFWFGLDSGRNPRRSVLFALSLVERRARWAGCPRPEQLTLSRWYQPLARQGAGESRTALETLVRLADWALHAPDRPELSPPLNDADILRICRDAVQSWTRARFRASISLPPRKAMT